MDDVNGTTKVIQMQFPITWLLSVAATLIVLGGGLFMQLNSATSGIADLKGSVQEIKKAQENRDDRMGMISTSNLEVRSQMNDIQRQMTRLTDDVSELRKQEQYRQNEKRFAPK